VVFVFYTKKFCVLCAKQQLEDFKFVQNGHKLTEQLKQKKKLKLLLTIKTIRAIIIFVPREQQRTSKSSKNKLKSC